VSEVLVPKLNNNDSEYTLVEWLVDEGAEVRPGDPVAAVETSKAVEELACETGGLLHRLVSEGSACAPGQAIGTIVASAEALSAMAATTPADPSPSPARSGGPIITEPAQALIDEHGIEPALVHGLGIPVVRSGDIEALLGTAQEGPAQEDRAQEDLAQEDPAQALPRAQRAVATAVQRSWQTIPAAFTAVKMRVDPALAQAKLLSRELRAMVGLPELLVQAIAGMRQEFPLFFAELTGGYRVRSSDSAHVGVTMDVGEGLYVPVVHDADRRTLKEIADTLMRFRMTALRGGFTEADLSGGNIVLALNNDAGAVLAVPIIYPGQACAVSLCAPQPELVLADDGSVVRRTVVTVGLAYDHRLVNGRDAMLFLQGLRHALEGSTGS
jgi:2-oxoglutarate dehydrogenase E2 component (dihydrolipoamide succinyltransferase)